VGLLCAFGWWTLGLNIKHSAVDSIDLVLGSVLNKIYRWEPGKPSIDDLIGKATPPVERHRLPKGMVRLQSTGSFHQKNALIISAISTPRYAVGTMPG